MSEERALEGITIGGQPDRDQLARSVGQGVVAVVNLRHSGEPDQPLSPEEEGKIVRSHGLAYLHLPIGGVPISRSDVQSLSLFLAEQSPGAVLVHCKGGGRATAMVLLSRADSEGWPADEVIGRGRGLGLVLPPPLQALVTTYLESRP